MKQLALVQNIAVKIIAEAMWSDPALPYHRKFNILIVENIYQLQIAMFMSKFNNKLTPTSFRDYFSLTFTMHSKDVRSSSNYFLISFKALPKTNQTS